MYEELVKELQDSAEWADSLAILMGRTDGDTHAPIMRKAADAIEELQGRAKVLEKVADKWCEAVPQWIPVTDKEHFPNTDHGVVGYFGGGAFNQLRWYDFVTILSDGAIVGESTERDVINEHCIAVYKLPDPPKEGE